MTLQHFLRFGYCPPNPFQRHKKTYRALRSIIWLMLRQVGDSWIRSPTGSLSRVITQGIHPFRGSDSEARGAYLATDAPALLHQIALGGRTSWRLQQRWRQQHNRGIHCEAQRFPAHTRADAIGSDRPGYSEAELTPISNISAPGTELFPSGRNCGGADVFPASTARAFAGSSRYRPT